MGIPTVQVDYPPLKALTTCGSSHRLSGLKVYVHLLSMTRSGVFESSALEISRTIDMDRGTVSDALDLLNDLRLVRGNRLLSLGEQYFQVPRSFVSPELYRGQSPATVLVFLTLLSRANQKDSPHVWTTAKALGSDLRMDRRTVSTALKSLSAASFVRVEPGEVVILDPRTGEALHTPVQSTDEKSVASLPIPMEETPPESTGKEISFYGLLQPKFFRQYYAAALEIPEMGDDTSKAQWNVTCPFHDDRHPSLSVNVEHGVFACHAPSCGAQGGMQEFECRLLPTKDKRQARQSIARKLGVRLTGTRGKKVKDSEHVYRDENAEPVAKKERYHYGNEPVNARTSVYRWSAISRKWVRGLAPGTPRLLYNLPEVLKAQTVIVCEGETKVDPVSVLHLVDDSGQPVAVTTSGGVNSWQDQFADHLRGKRVLIFRDGDEEGLNYAKSITASLARLGIEHKVVSFAEYGRDVRDLLKVEGFSVVELLEHCESDWLQESEGVKA